MLQNVPILQHRDKTCFFYALTSAGPRGWSAEIETRARKARVLTPPPPQGSSRC